MTHTVELPWPSKALHPNAREHWASKARAAKKARHDAKIACLAAGARGIKADRLTLTYVFHPPDRRNRDDDGLLASMKAYRDGIADAIGMDDKDFTTGAPEFGEPVKNGAVLVRISAPHERAREGA